MTDLSLSRSQMLLLSGSANRRPRRRGGRPSGAAPLPGHAPAVRRRRAVRQDRRERARAGRLHHPAHQPAGREHDGAAAPDGRRQAGQRGPGHGGHSLLRVRPAGPEGPAAGGDQRQADGQHGLDGGRGPGAGDGLPPAPAAGVLRPAGRPPVRGAGVREPLTGRRRCATWSSWRPTWARPRWRAASPSGSTRRSRSSTSGARRPTSPRC